MKDIENNPLTEEEYCHYSGLPSLKFYENIEEELKLINKSVEMEIIESDTIKQIKN